MFNISIIDKNNLLAAVVSNYSNMVYITDMANEKFLNQITNMCKDVLDAKIGGQTTMKINATLDRETNPSKTVFYVYLIRVSKDQFAMLSIVDNAHCESRAEHISEMVLEYKQQDNGNVTE